MNIKIHISVALKEENCEKDMIDSLRCRNGNLEICISQQETASVEL